MKKEDLLLLIVNNARLKTIILLMDKANIKLELEHVEYVDKIFDDLHEWLKDMCEINE